MNTQLTAEEARLIGCLMEKAVTTPDQYPLSLNALTNACNQKSSREPVMNLTQGTVQRTTGQLADKYLLSKKEGAKAGTDKYAQRLCNTPLGEIQFDAAQYALITLMLLRGAQTPGELRSRSGRLYQFDDNQAVSATLEQLMEREGGAVVARLPRQAGRMDHEYTHLFCGEVESAPVEIETRVTAPPQQAVMTPQQGDKIAQLEARVKRLEQALTSLANNLGEEIDLGG